MLSFFKSKNRKPTKKGKAFYERENLIQTIDELIEILSMLDFEDNIKGKVPILFQGKEFNTINKNTLEEFFGEESFLLNPDNSVSGHEVFYYRRSSEHLKFLIQIHFIDDQFFLAGTKIYSDALLSNNDKQKVIKNITDKYHPDADAGMQEFNIMDPDGNILWSKDDIFYHINYLYNSAYCQQLKKQYWGLGKPKDGQEIKNTLDDLI